VIADKANDSATYLPFFMPFLGLLFLAFIFINDFFDDLLSASFTIQ